MSQCIESAWQHLVLIDYSCKARLIIRFTSCAMLKLRYIQPLGRKGYCLALLDPQVQPSLRYMHACFDILCQCEF